MRNKVYLKLNVFLIFFSSVSIVPASGLVHHFGPNRNISTTYA